MSVRFATSDEISRWDDLLITSPDGGNIFSTKEYALQKAHTGYRHHFVMVGHLPVTILEKSTPPIGKLWYLPKGPNVTTAQEVLKVLKPLATFAKKHGVFAIRIESEIPRKQASTLTRHGLVKAAPIIPNPSTITLSLAPKLDDILMSLPQKGRHAIRRAERDGVTIERVKATPENCKTMYALLFETAEGQFGIRSYDYFESFWQRFEKSGHGQLFFASFDGQVVAGAYAMILGKKSTYKDGASTRKRQAYGASHLLQWEVISWAKENGAKIHDFCGSPPSDEITNTKHPHYGVGRFKLSFSKDVVDYIGCYDMVLAPTAYKLWQKGLERLYRGVYRRLTGDYYY